MLGQVYEEKKDLLSKIELLEDSVKQGVIRYNKEKANNETLFGLNDELNRKNEKLSTDIKALSEANNRLKAELLAVKDKQRHEVQDNVEKSVTHNTTLQKENQKLNENNTVLTQSITTLQAEIKNIYEQDNVLSQKLNRYMDEIKTIIPQIKISNDHYVAKIKEIDSFRALILQKTLEITKLQQSQHSNNTMSEKISINKKVNTLNEERGVLQHSLAYLELNEAVAITTRLNEHQVKLDKQHENLIREINNWLQNKLDYYQKHNFPFTLEEKNRLTKYVRNLDDFADTIKEKTISANLIESNAHRNLQLILASRRPEICHSMTNDVFIKPSTKRLQIANSDVKLSTSQPLSNHIRMEAEAKIHQSMTFILSRGSPPKMTQKAMYIPIAKQPLTIADKAFNETSSKATSNSSVNDALTFE